MAYHGRRVLLTLLRGARRRSARPPWPGSMSRGRSSLRLTGLIAAFGALLTSIAAPAEAGVTHVAVAANFTEPAREIAALFKQKTGHEAVLIFGASGTFYTQITHGAPFGTAAVETVKALGVYDALKPKIVQGISIAQAFQFVDTRNAEVGFVALSQLHGVTEGTRWEVPPNLHAPIRQDAVLLKTGADSEASVAFLAFLKGPEARAIIEQFAYALE